MPQDYAGLKLFMGRFHPPHGIMVTRDTYAWDEKSRILSVPLLTFLLAF